MTNPLTPQSLLKRTKAARAEASTLLGNLLLAKEHSEARMAALHMSDSIKRVTGQSSLDRAIESTRHMIDTLDRNHQQIHREFALGPDVCPAERTRTRPQVFEPMMVSRVNAPLGA